MVRLCFSVVAFLLANLNPDFAIENSIFCSIEDQINLRLQAERSTYERRSLRFVQIGISIWFHIFVPFNETAFRSQKCARSSVITAGQG